MQRADSHSMDPWRQDERRRKRTFEEMSQRRTRSPQPLFFGQDNSRSRSPDRRPPFFQRRRTSHPHNHPPTPAYASPDIMAGYRPHQPPNLEHRASQTIIDLTDDADIPPLSQLSQSRPPQLHRSDRLDLGDIIDLTEDVEEDEIEITHSISVVPPPRDQSRELPRPANFPQPSLLERALNVPVMAFQGAFPNMIPHLHRHYHRPAGHAGHDAGFRHHRPHDHHHHQAMPELNYQHHAFQPVEPQRPPHEPPPAAREGFTRSPGEDDIIVCPSCEQELVATKGGNEQATPKKSSKSKPQSKKDREEHPFWVVRACGHVYCNACFQGRKADKRFLFDNPKAPICCVDECQSDVSSKSRWVGVFL